MSNILFTADPHLGHRNINKFRTFTESCEDNVERFFKEAEAKMQKRTITFFLGDVCFDPIHLPRLKALRGKKIFIPGNHDRDVMTPAVIADIFDSVEGLYKYKEFWLSHAPIHPAELRGKINLHGHVHYATVDDPRYINCCPEANDGQYFMSLERLREIVQSRQICS